MNEKQLIITWEQFHKDSKKLGEKLLHMAPWDGIIAVARGGLVPSTIIAHILSIRSIDTACIASYNDKTKAKEIDLEILQGVTEKQGKWLVIDDLSDTGHTAQIIREMLPTAYIACVYSKPKGEPFIDLFAEHIPQDTWIVLPWEG